VSGEGTIGEVYYRLRRGDNGKKEIILCKNNNTRLWTKGGVVAVDGKYRHVERGNTHLSIDFGDIFRGG